MDARLKELGAEVSASLERARIARANDVRAKLVAREAPRLRTEWKRPTPSSRMLPALAAAACVALTIVFARPRHEKKIVSASKEPVALPLSFVVDGAKRGTPGDFIAAPSAGETPVTFSDGSELRLAPAAQVRVFEIAHNGARVLVERGTVHVSVAHREETRWSVEAGPFAVNVTGTKFDVAWDPVSTGLRLQMQEGSVRVRGCGLEDRRLVAGEALDVTCKDPAPVPVVTPSSLPTAPPPVVVKAEPSKGESPKAEPTPKTEPARDVIALARRGSHVEALAAAEANGFENTCEHLEVADLLLLADAARYAGRFERATQALETTRRRFAGTEGAATAAFELGRIAMDVRHDPASGGDHFETYLRERPNGSLAREALGRALEARHRSGDTERAERLAARYLAAYPDGPHTKLAQRLMAP